MLVVKKGLIANWQREFAAHTNIRLRLLSQDRNANFAAFNSPVRVYLCHFEVLISEKKRLLLFLKTRRVGIILDESQKFKNPDANITRALFQLSDLFTKRIIMTGTPIANRPYDIWAQIYFLDRGKSLGSDFSSFKSGFDLTADLASNADRRKEFEKNLTALFGKISAFSVRETKRGANISLPNKEIRNIETEWEVAQGEMYKTVRDEMRTVVVREGIPREDDAELVLKRLLRLVQIASNPTVIDESYHAIPGKMPALQDILDEILRAGEKAIVWTSFTRNADWLVRQLRGLGAIKVHGKMAMADRNRSIEQFMGREERKVLVATPGAAKEGLTLTVANHVIFYDRTFSLDDYLQAQDRIHRISQDKTCYIYNLIMEDSIDEWVDVLLRSKELAAKLGQGDITEEEYLATMDYDYAYVLSKILGMETN
jgi:SNF2 family DNA or RNA helicase